MFHIDFICEGVYDLWYQDGNDDHDWHFMGTYDSYEQAEDEANAFSLFHPAGKDYTL